MKIRTIVVGYNASESCNRAVGLAARLAQKVSATVHVVGVSPAVVPLGGFGWVAPYETTAYLDQILRERVHEGAKRCPDSVQVEEHAELGSPSSEIVRMSKELGADLVVLGLTRHTALERFFVGSTADRAVRLSHVPCYVAGADTLPTRVLICIDDSDFAKDALTTGLALAQAVGAEARCLHAAAEPPPPAAMVGTFDVDYYVERLRKSFEDHVEAVRGASDMGLPTPETAVRLGAAKENILAEAGEWKADLIVLGTHGRGFVGRAVLGSVSEGILRESPVSVLVVPPKP